MILAVDVHYRDPAACAAGLVFDAWDSAVASSTLIERFDAVADYVPGRFYLRELPCVLPIVRAAMPGLSAIVIDGYVMLGPDRPGLGMHLWQRLDGAVPVVGVAKTRFVDTPAEAELVRGTSARPLFVTAAGITPDEAKACIARMHGAHRIPTLLKQVDALCRGGV